MLTELEVFGQYAAASALPLDGGTSETDPIQIKSIDGLGPVKANITTAPYASSPGEFFIGSSVEKRNIVITVGLNPNWVDQSMASLRQNLYAYFMTNQMVKLRFSGTHIPTVQIAGFVEAMEDNMFSRDPEIQVSVVCPQPDFVAIDPTVIEGVLGELVDAIPINYPGTIPTGYHLKIESTPDLVTYSGSVIIENRNPLPHLFLCVVTIDATHFFEMSSFQGSKYVQIVRTTDGVTTNILPETSILDGWPEFTPGENLFAVIATTPGQAWTLTYYVRLGGL